LQKSLRRAFYPCCADDVSEPRRLLTGLVDEMIYCDLRKPTSWDKEAIVDSTPAIRFVCEDATRFIPQLPVIDVFFYRRDSSGEGGSGLYLLGKRWLPQILDRFASEGGLIIADGSNSGGGMFQKMTRPGGYAKESWGWRFRPTPDQPWLESHGLHIISVSRIT
jgi:hypothetical protein